MRLIPALLLSGACGLGMAHPARVLAAPVLNVQVINVCDDAGANCALDNYSAAVKHMSYNPAATQAIFAQAGVAVNFLGVAQYDSTAFLNPAVVDDPVNGYTTGSPTDQAHQLLDIAGHHQNTDPNVLNVFVVNSLPHTGVNGSTQAVLYGLGLLNGNGAVVTTGINTVGSVSYAAPLDNIAHELAHNLGLVHTDAPPLAGTPIDTASNLLNSATRNYPQTVCGITGVHCDGAGHVVAANDPTTYTVGAKDILTPGQVAQVQASAANLFTVDLAQVDSTFDRAQDEDFPGIYSCGPYVGGRADRPSNCTGTIAFTSSDAGAVLNEVRIRFASANPETFGGLRALSGPCAGTGTVNTLPAGGVELVIDFAAGCFTQGKTEDFYAGQSYTDTTPFSIEYVFADGTASTAAFSQTGATLVASSTDPIAIANLLTPRQDGPALSVPTDPVTYGASTVVDDDATPVVDTPAPDGTPVPEPATLVLFAAAACALASCRRRTRARLRTTAMIVPALLGTALAGAAPVLAAPALNVQVINVCDDAGANCALSNYAAAIGFSYNPAATRAIFAQAGIGVNVLQVAQLNSSAFLNPAVVDDPIDGYNTGSPTDPAHHLLDQPGHLQNTDPNVLNVFVVNSLPHIDANGSLRGTLYGLGLLNGNGAVVTTGINAVNGISYAAPLDNIAHELAHNLGLTHTDAAPLAGTAIDTPFNLLDSVGRNVPYTLCGIAGTLCDSNGHIVAAGDPSAVTIGRKDVLSVNQIAQAQASAANLFTVDLAQVDSVFNRFPVDRIGTMSCGPFTGGEGAGEGEGRVGTTSGCSGTISFAASASAAVLNQVRVRFADADLLTFGDVRPLAGPCGGSSTTNPLPAGGVELVLDFAPACFTQGTTASFDITGSQTDTTPFSIQYVFDDGTASTAAFDESGGSLVASSLNPIALGNVLAPRQDGPALFVPTNPALFNDISVIDGDNAPVVADPPPDGDPIPEPATLALFAGGAWALAARRRARQPAV